MIVVRVELHSAITGQVEEIGRMVIDNIGGTKQVGEYRVRTLRGRSRAALDAAWAAKSVTREGRVHRHHRLKEHVWNLVAKALVAAGYTPSNFDTTRFYPEARRRGLTAVDSD
jgi:hypothetical protein